MTSLASEKVSFITVLFDDPIELALMQLQAHSFIFMQDDIIGEIMVVLDGLSEEEIIGRGISDKILNCYPFALRSLVSINSSNSMLSSSPHRQSWFNQQAIKILAASISKYRYSVILDAKNHFFKHVSVESLFPNNKPQYFLEKHSPEMLHYYANVLEFFGGEDPHHGILHKIQTVTPFIFENSIIRSMISYINKREGVSLAETMHNSRITEFFSYFIYGSSILADSSSFFESISLDGQHTACTIGACNPKDNPWNSLESRLALISKNESILVFGVHRKAISFLDSEYKKGLLDFYRTTYGGIVESFVASNILQLPAS